MDRLQSLWIARRLSNNMGLGATLNVAFIIGIIWIVFMILAPICIVTGIIGIVKLSKKLKGKK